MGKATPDFLLMRRNLPAGNTDQEFHMPIQAPWNPDQYFDKLPQLHYRPKATVLLFAQLKNVLWLT